MADVGVDDVCCDSKEIDSDNASGLVLNGLGVVWLVDCMAFF